MVPGFSHCLRFCSALLLAFSLAAAAQTAPKSKTQSKTQSAATQTNTGSQTPVVTAHEQNGKTQYTIQQQVNEVDLVFSVTDKHGRFINDLSEGDFALLDDQRAPERVYSFTRQTNLPLRVGIMIDTSTSIRQRFGFEQKAAISFLLQTLKPRIDRAFVMGFDITPDYTQDWTNNLDLLTQGIDNLHPGGGTALYDSLYSACRDKMLGVSQRSGPVRKAIILVSDGDDNQSHAYLDDAIKECQRASTIVYTISTNTSYTRDNGDKVLAEIAEATGGRVFFPKSLADMPMSFKAIQEELRSQYRIVYEPADFKDDGAFRSIYLVSRNRKYRVHAMKGYFAPKPSQE